MGAQTNAFDLIIYGSGQNLTIGAASVASAVVGPATYAVRLNATGNCHVAIAQTPTATATDMLLLGTEPGFVIAIRPGFKVAVIQDGASTGTLNFVELTH